jgi:capsular polysaccharide export protein
MFKHHPIDRGRKNYKNFICEQSRILGISDRVLVVHEVHLPTCLQHALGTVTINSTVGLSSLYHETATITLGNAIYDIEGLTNKNKKLKDFWKNPQKPDMNLLAKFRQHLISTTQLNGSFYGRMPKELG